MVVDLHTHTTFSDGKFSLDEVVGFAVENGCDALAITDHSSREFDSATPAYFEAVRRARRAYPGLVLIGGLEWNIPPYGGREHVSVLVRPELEEASLTTLKASFEGDAPIADALRWFEKTLPSTADAVAFYNHPSRSDEDITENATDILAWQRGARVFVGFEGGPGHQRRAAIGSYQQSLFTEDRWDPVVSEIGGVWDSLLDAGHDVWGALATSDFHNDRLDYRPCEFARTHLRVPAPTPQGVIQGLRAGSFWAGHGQILDRMELSVAVPGLELPLVPGEAAFVASGQRVHWSLRITRGSGARSGPLAIEIVSNCRAGKPEVIDSASLSPEDQLAEGELEDLKPGGDQASCYLRARVRKAVADGPDLMAYGNPVRLRLIETEPEVPGTTPARKTARDSVRAEPADQPATVDATRDKARARTTAALEEALAGARTRGETTATWLRSRLEERLARPRARAAEALSRLDATMAARNAGEPIISRRATRTIVQLSREAQAVKQRLDKMATRYTPVFLAKDPLAVQLNGQLLLIEQQIADARSTGAASHLQRTTDAYDTALRQLKAVESDNDEVLRRFEAYREAVERDPNPGPTEDADADLAAAKRKLASSWALVHRLRAELQEPTAATSKPVR